MVQHSSQGDDQQLERDVPLSSASCPVPPEICRRQYYRLRYPENDRPTIQVDESSYPVTEISEGGMRFYSATPEIFEEGQYISGVITFRDLACVTIYAHVGRRTPDEVILVFRPNLTFARVMEEQRWISRKYLRPAE